MASKYYAKILEVIENNEDLSWGVGCDGWMDADELAQRIAIAIEKMDKAKQDEQEVK